MERLQEGRAEALLRRLIPNAGLEDSQVGKRKSTLSDDPYSSDLISDSDSDRPRDSEETLAHEETQNERDGNCSSGGNKNVYEPPTSQPSTHFQAKEMETQKENKLHSNELQNEAMANECDTHRAHGSHETAALVTDVDASETNGIGVLMAVAELEMSESVAEGRIRNISDACEGQSTEQRIGNRRKRIMPRG